jgi:hypothetical protein
MNWAKPPSSAAHRLVVDDAGARAQPGERLHDARVVEVAETLLASRIADFFDSIDLGNPVCSLCTAD